MQVTDAPGARLAASAGQSTGESSPDPEKSESSTVMSVSTTLPVLVTSKL